MGKEKQFAIAHREILHTSLGIPGSTVKTFLKDAVCLVNTCRFVCSFDIHIPIGMNTIIKIGNGAEVFCILGCSRSNHGRTLQITDYAFTIQPFTRIHHINIGNNRTFLIHISRSQVINILAFGQLSPCGSIPQLKCFIYKKTIPIQSGYNRNLCLVDSGRKPIDVSIIIFTVTIIKHLQHQLLSR